MRLKSPETSTLIFKQRPYTYIKERRNRTKIYCADDGKSFLRFGPIVAIDAELKFHKHLIEREYPVPTIIEEGSWEGAGKYFIESSAGFENFGILFRDDFAKHGAISDEMFGDFLSVTRQYIEAQQKSEIAEQDWESVFLGTHFDTLLEERPKQKDLIMNVWERVRTNLADTPFVLCHGDFNAFNILPGGVIDFETTFNGPRGYDLVSAAASIELFPTEGDFELPVFGKYSYTPKQKQTLLALQPESTTHYDTLFLLRSVWSVVGMSRYPKLQTWRYEKFQKLMDEYLTKNK